MRCCVVDGFEIWEKLRVAVLVSKAALQFIQGENHFQAEPTTCIAFPGILFFSIFPAHNFPSPQSL
ncbi:hypothetical protein LINPERPRIM_LOCUS2030 [Linum perenne]